VKFFEDIAVQRLKYGQTVCGDVFLCCRGSEGTVLIACDGIGSGVYANIAAISCASRLQELLYMGVSLRVAAEMVAASMHQARRAESPFSAFSAAMVLNDGRFSVYMYESPEAICILNGWAQVLKATFYTAGYEVVGEASGVLDIGDSLILSSDGVTQAGLGHGHGFGISTQGVVSFINKQSLDAVDIHKLPEKILAHCASVSGGRHEDDATLAALHCREASQLSILTGPPSLPSKDAVYVSDFMAMPGKKVICGSTTTEIAGRELAREVKMLQVGASFGSPPEYFVEGVDLTTEGTIMLNQVYNILDEPVENFQDGIVERLCAMLAASDVVHFFVGSGANAAHSSLLFKQIGIMPRKKTIRLITEKLQSMGKLVTERQY
jgi:hypothetical protein